MILIRCPGSDETMDDDAISDCHSPGDHGTPCASVAGTVSLR